MVTVELLRGRHVWRSLITVVGPGLIVLFELALLPVSGSGDLFVIVTWMNRLGVLAAIVAVPLVMFAAYCAGQAVRGLMFALWHAWRTREDWQVLLEPLRRVFGARVVDEILREHSLAVLVDPGRDDTPPEDLPFHYDPNKGSQVDMAILEYLKYWLSTREHADLGITHLEIEINLFVIAPFLVALGAVVGLKLLIQSELAQPTWSGVAAGILLVVVGSYVMRRFWRESKRTAIVDQEDAIRNFIIANVLRRHEISGC